MDDYSTSLRVENTKSWLFLLLQMVLVVAIVAFVWAHSTKSFYNWCKKKIKQFARCCCWCCHLTDAKLPPGNGSTTTSAGNGLNTLQQQQQQQIQLQDQGPPIHQKVLNYTSKPTLIDEDTLTRWLHKLTRFTQPKFDFSPSLLSDRSNAQ